MGLTIHKILSCDQIKAAESEATIDYFISEEILMENAAHAVFNTIVKYFSKFSKVIILCGPGNNGGDGLALARILKSKNFNVKVWLPMGPKYRYKASINNYNCVKKMGLISETEPNFNSDELIIDAIFGTGLNREISIEMEGLINRINLSGSPVISLDIPSGINGDSGQIMGNRAVNADITVTFIALKLGNINFPGANLSKKIVVDRISVPTEVFNKLNTPVVNNYIPITKRGVNIHKSSYGRVLTVGGSKNYFGAPYLASKASLLAGSGYSILISDQSVTASISSIAPEVIYDDISNIKKQVEACAITVVGPGLGVSEDSKIIFNNVVRAYPKKLLIDGDGLTILSKDLDSIKGLSGELVLTPHPKEMARLLNVKVSEVESNRVLYAKRLSELTGGIVVLKGKFTVISIPNGDVFINTVSSNSLATAGSGDILCGIISGLSGYLDLAFAVRAGVYVHGLLGVIASEKIGSFGVTSTKLLELLPEAINSYLNINPQPDLEIVL